MTNYNFTTEALLDMIIDRLEEGYEGAIYEELHHEAFNTYEGFTYTTEAEKALDDEVGIFEAIDEVLQYETNTFGNILTPIDACSIANMLTYIRGEQVMYNHLDDIMTKYDELETTEENTKNMIKDITEVKENL